MRSELLELTEHLVVVATNHEWAPLQFFGWLSQCAPVEAEKQDAKLATHFM
jgi:hypothetical protein